MAPICSWATPPITSASASPASLTGELAMPGPVERERFLGSNCAMARSPARRGVLVATGRPDETAPRAEPARRAA